MSPATRFLLAFGALIAACGAPPRAVQPAPVAADEPVAELVPGVAFGLDWLPADTATVERYPAGKVALVTMFQGWLRGREPACFTALTAKLTAAYVARRDPVYGGVTVFEGDWRRDEVEGCIVEVARAMRKNLPPLRRDGAITTLTGGNDQDFAHLGWIADGRTIVWDQDRAQVEAVLAMTEKVKVGDPLATLLARIDPKRVAIVSTADFASERIGVPSEGLVVHKGEANQPLVGRLLFATPEAARHAHKVLMGKLQRDEFDPALARMLVWMTLEIDGRDIVGMVAPSVATTFMVEGVAGPDVRPPKSW